MERSSKSNGEFLLRFSGRLFFSQLGPPPLLTWLFVVLVFPQLFLHSASINQLLYSSQRLTDRFFNVNAHPQPHSPTSVSASKKKSPPSTPSRVQIPEHYILVSIDSRW